MSVRRDVRTTQENARMELDLLRRREAAALAKIATSNAATELALEREIIAIRRLNLAPHVPQLKADRLAEVKMFSLRILRQGKQFLLLNSNHIKQLILLVFFAGHLNSSSSSHHNEKCFLLTKISLLAESICWTRLCVRSVFIIILIWLYKTTIVDMNYFLW